LPQFVADEDPEGKVLPSDVGRVSLTKYLIISKKGAFTDRHFDLSGSTTFMTLLVGQKEWSLIPPMYLSLLKDDKIDLSMVPIVTFLSTIKLTALWLHSVRTAEDSVGFGGSYLRHQDSDMQVYAWLNDLEDRVPVTNRYPGFMTAMWYTLKNKRGNSNLHPFLARELLRETVLLPDRLIVPGSTFKAYSDSKEKLFSSCTG